MRHHDDHSPLEAGPLGDYLHLTTPDELIEDIAGVPWTRDQIDFVDDQTPVRVVIGRPGSGKTTVLWKAVEARTDERVLYLARSSALTRHAEERFRSFAPVEVDIVARDFTTFLGEARGADVPRQTLGESRKKFRDALTRLSRDAGPWARRPHALHTELRGFFFGRAAPGNTRDADDGAIARLHDDAYAELRGDHEVVGEKRGKALLRGENRRVAVRVRPSSTDDMTITLAGVRSRPGRGVRWRTRSRRRLPARWGFRGRTRGSRKARARCCRSR